MIPKQFFLTKGVGVHKDCLQSFELALRDAGIQAYNLVKVSSIIPPGCNLITKDEGQKILSPGEITFAVLSKNCVNELNRLIAASIGVAIPAHNENYGYLSEYHSFDENEEKASAYVEDLAATMLATTMGINFDLNKTWDEKKQIFKTSKLIIKTSNITQSAKGRKGGKWTTAIAAAVFVP
jgi:arginine decarboxylase